MLGRGTLVFAGLWLLLIAASAATLFDRPYDDTALGLFRAADWWAEPPSDQLGQPWTEIAATVPHGWYLERSLAGRVLAQLMGRLSPDAVLLVMHLVSLAGAALLGVSLEALSRTWLPAGPRWLLVLACLASPWVLVPTWVMAIELWVAALSLAAVALVAGSRHAAAALLAALVAAVAWAMHPLGVVTALLVTVLAALPRLDQDHSGVSGPVFTASQFWLAWLPAWMSLIGGALFWRSAMLAPLPPLLIPRPPLWQQPLGNWGAVPLALVWLAAALILGAVHRLRRPAVRQVSTGQGRMARLVLAVAEHPLPIAGIVSLAGYALWWVAIERQLVVREWVLVAPWLYLMAAWQLGGPRPFVRATWTLAIAGLAVSLLASRGPWLPAVDGPHRDGAVLERSLAYRRDLTSKHQAARVVAEKAQGRPLLLGYPWTILLTRPRLGYVAQPLAGYALESTSVPTLRNFWEIWSDPPYEPVFSQLDHPAYRASLIRVPQRSLADSVLFEDGADLAFYARRLIQEADSPSALAEWYLRQMIFDPQLASQPETVILPCSRILEQRGQAALALELCRMATEAAPDQPELRLRQAELQLALGQGEACLETIDLVLELENQLGGDAASLRRKTLRIAAHYLEGVALVRRRQLSSAATAFEQVLSEAADNPEAHCQLGVVLLMQQQLDPAAEHLAQATRLKPDFAEAFGNLGVVRAQQARLEEAEVMLREAVRLSPGYAEGHNNLGAVLLRQGRFDEAIAHFQAALAILPQYEEARQGLAQARSRQTRSAPPGGP